ncbi:hypothetical protein B0H14DRAFT_3099686 [Mycena olivaceomarginata]|nr:hypothetical protein B0H14DRAFT_3099686 [Mycena olivaceomarginata]
MDVSQLGSFAQNVLLNAFRSHYQRFQTAVTDLVGSNADAIVISRLGDDIDEFAEIVNEDAVDASHHGHPVLVQTISSGGPGRPRIYIDPDFLRWAYGQRSTAGISRFLGVGRSTVRNALIEHGIAQPQPTPFQTDTNYFVTGPVSEISDDDLDMLLLRLRTHYRRAGLSMLNGMLRRLGHRVPTERVRQSLLRIDPVRRILSVYGFGRREYRVLGPNSLWHHDGQHGNLLSVHNVRIERLWVDVTAQVGATWAEHFTALEIRYGLDINNVAHIWLLHFLFLGTINTQLAFFAEAWNQHRIQIRNSTNRSPTDMFVFDMYVNGVRGDRLPPEEENLNEEELEVYGIDWQGLRDNGVLQSQAQNNSMGEGSSSWVGRTGPPPDLIYFAEMTVIDA